jgi:cytochrome P450
MIDDEWVREHFDYVSDDLAHNLHGTLAKARELCPVTHSDAMGGYWVVTKYEDVLRIAQDWDTFSSQLGVTIPHKDNTALSIPEHIDPPEHREYKRLINAYFTPAVVAQYEGRTRALVHSLIDDFIEKGECDFQEEFAVPFPARAFFEFVLKAPSDEVVRLGELSTAVSNPNTPDVAACYKGLTDWIDAFVEDRRRQPERGDVVDAVLAAQIDGRPITYTEVQAIILLLILGGLETTTGALGQIMMRFCREPEIPRLLRDQRGEGVDLLGVGQP